MDIHIMKIIIYGVYFIQNSAIVKTEAGENTEEIEVYRDRAEG